MNIINWYKNLSLKLKNTIWMAIVGLLGVFVLLPFAIKGDVGLLFGLLLGTIIEISCYWLLCLTTEGIAKSANGQAKNSLIVFSTLGFFIRFILYAAGLVLAAFSTFKWDVDYFNVWTTFAGYMPMVIIIAITTLKSNKVEEK